MGRIKGFLTGGIIGAVLGILFAPKTGDESRKQLSEESAKLTEKAKKTYEDVKPKLDEIVSKAKEMFGEKK